MALLLEEGKLMLAIRVVRKAEGVGLLLCGDQRQT